MQDTWAFIDWQSKRARYLLQFTRKPPHPYLHTYSSVLAGTLGALASVFGKLGFDEQALMLWLSTSLDGASSSSPLILLARGTCVGMMLLCNVAMTSFFIQSLHQSGSLLATVINTSISFIVTGLAGRLLFKETLSRQWWGGAGLTLAGVALLAGCAPATKTGSEEEMNRNRKTRRREKEDKKVLSPVHRYNTRRRKPLAAL